MEQPFTFICSDLISFHANRYRTAHYLASTALCRHTPPHTNTQSHTRPAGQLTPANAQVDFEVIPLCEHSDDQEVVEVDAFHQQPVAVGHDTVLHHHHGDATADRRLQDSSEVYFMNDFFKKEKNEAIWC